MSVRRRLCKQTLQHLLSKYFPKLYLSHSLSSQSYDRQTDKQTDQTRRVTEIHTGTSALSHMQLSELTVKPSQTVVYKPRPMASS